MKTESDGPQILDFFTRPAKKVLRELIGHMRLAGLWLVTSTLHFASIRIPVVTMDIVLDIVCYIVCDIVFLYIESTDIVYDIV
jgi:hypothetical protein